MMPGESVTLCRWCKATAYHTILYIIRTIWNDVTPFTGFKQLPFEESNLAALTFATETKRGEPNATTNDSYSAAGGSGCSGLLGFSGACRCQGQRLSSSNSSVQLKNVRMITMIASTPTL